MYFVGRVKVNCNGYPQSISLKDRLSFILPSWSGDGRALFAMIYFLAYQQNEFLEKCQIISGMKQKKREIALWKLTEHDLISYHPDKDLLPLVYAYCDYSLEIGRGTKVEYNLLAIEKHFIENMTFCKPTIIIQIACFDYTDEVRKSKKFLRLREVVQQVSYTFNFKGRNEPKSKFFNTNF